MTERKKSREKCKSFFHSSFLSYKIIFKKSFSSFQKWETPVIYIVEGEMTLDEVKAAVVKIQPIMVTRSGAALTGFKKAVIVSTTEEELA